MAGVPEPGEPPDRPQPVLEAARVAGLVQAAVVAVGAVCFLIAAGVTEDNLGAFGISVGAAVGALIALAMYVLSVWQARKAAAKVTPLRSPVDERGVALVPVDRAA